MGGETHAITDYPLWHRLRDFYSTLQQANIDSSSSKIPSQLKSLSYSNQATSVFASPETPEAVTSNSPSARCSRCAYICRTMPPQEVILDAGARVLVLKFIPELARVDPEPPYGLTGACILTCAGMGDGCCLRGWHISDSVTSMVL